MNNSLKQQVALFRAMQEMREEMDRVWKDFFEKNPEQKEEVVRGWLEERLRSLQNSEDQDKGVFITAQNAQRKKLRSEFR
jgi:bacterioferritin (cytochrome b1)